MHLIDNFILRTNVPLRNKEMSHAFLERLTYLKNRAAAFGFQKMNYLGSEPSEGLNHLTRSVIPVILSLGLATSYLVNI
jgi:hypothetical protein